MKQCLIYDNSLKFSRAIAGILTLIAFFVHNHWLVLIAAILVGLRVFSVKIDILYQLYTFALVKILKNKLEPAKRDLGEINFVSAMMSGLLLIGFLLLHFEKFVDFAWIFILTIALLIFLACFVGFCVATLMYVFFKKIFKSK